MRKTSEKRRQDGLQDGERAFGRRDEAATVQEQSGKALP